MQHAVLLVCYSWMRFNSRSYLSLAPCSSDQRVFGELELRHNAQERRFVYAIDPAASGGGFQSRYGERGRGHPVRRSSITCS